MSNILCFIACHSTLRVNTIKPNMSRNNDDAKKMSDASGADGSNDVHESPNDDYDMHLHQLFEEFDMDNYTTVCHTDNNLRLLLCIILHKVHWMEGNINEIQARLNDIEHHHLDLVENCASLDWMLHHEIPMHVRILIRSCHSRSSGASLVLVMPTTKFSPL